MEKALYLVYKLSKLAEVITWQSQVFDLMITREFLRSVDYTELRRIELVIRDLIKEEISG